MTRNEAIKRSSVFLRNMFHDDLDSFAIIRVAEKEKDIETFSSALDQIIQTCKYLKRGLK